MYLFPMYQAESMQAALEAPWPPFTLLQISDLTPAEAIPAYARAGGEVLCHDQPDTA